MRVAGDHVDIGLSEKTSRLGEKGSVGLRLGEVAERPDERRDAVAQQAQPALQFRPGGQHGEPAAREGNRDVESLDGHGAQGVIIRAVPPFAARS